MEDDDYLDVIASKSGSTTVLKGTSFEDEIAGPCAFSPVEEGLRISLTDLSATPFFLTTTHTPIDSTGQAQRWNLVEGSGHYWDIWGEPPAGTAGTLTLHVTWTSSSNPSSQDYDIAYDLLLVGYRPIGSTRAGDDGGDEGDSPWNLETRLGQYHIAYAHSSGIKYRQSDFPAPPFAFTAVSVTATAGDDNPRMAEILHERSLVRLVFQRSGVVYRTDSYDDGASWSDPVTLFSAGSHPTIAYDPRSLCTLYACYHGGALKGRLQEPGDSEPGAEYAFTGIDTPADDSFHIAPAGDAVGTWMLVMKTGTSIKNYRSTDEGVSWSEVT